MFNVRVHFVGREEIRYKEIPLEQFGYTQLPNNIVYITIADEDEEIRLVFVVRNRANLMEKNNTDVDHITILGEGWRKEIRCENAEIYVVPMHVVMTMLKISKETRTKEWKKILKRIRGYANKRNIPRFEFCDYELRKIED